MRILYVKYFSLSIAIDMAMPPLLEKYNLEMEKYEAERKLLESVAPSPSLTTSGGNTTDIINVSIEIYHVCRSIIGQV